MLIRGKARLTEDLTWSLNWKSGSKVALSIEGEYIFKRQYRVVQSDLRMGVRLCKLRDE